MLSISVGGYDVYDEETETFSVAGGVEIDMEHSLVSLSKWESIHGKAFLSAQTKTPEELLSYLECMIVTPNYPRGILEKLTQELVDEINAYINAPMSATTFHGDQNKGPSREVVTSELVYFWMNSFQIEKECETWHFNRLIALIKVHSVKNSTKKMSRSEQLARNRELNAQRRAQSGSSG